MRNRLRSTASWLVLAAVIGVPGLAAAQEEEYGPVGRRSLGESGGLGARPIGQPPIVTEDEDVDPNVSVGDRPRPDYDPIGIRAGSFFFYPSLGAAGEYDDNVFADENDEEDDFGVIVTPSIQAQSDWSRHQLNVEVGAEGAHYFDFDENDYLDFFAQTDGQLDITRDNIVTGALGLERLHQDRSSADEEGTDADGSVEDVTTYWRETAQLDYRRNFNRVFAIVGGDFTRSDFDNEGDVSNQDRDRNQYRGRLRGGYELSPRIALFAEGTYDFRRYDDTPDDAGFDRDSEGYTGSIGTALDFTGILFGEFQIGYTSREYDDGELDDVNGLGGGGELTWNITPLTTIIFGANAEIQETTVTFEDDQASANFEQRVDLDVTHELLRNVLLNGNAAYIRDDFEGTSRTDDTVSAGAGLSYLLNRNLSLDATYNFTTRSSDADDGDYARNLVRLGVTARL